MPRSRVNLPLRLGLRGARVALRTTRGVADLGLVALELAERAIGGTEPAFEPARRASPPPGPPFGDASPGVASAGALDDEPPGEIPEDIVYIDGEQEPDPPIDVHVDAEAELVEELADPGAQDGAGASVRIAAPSPGYDALRAPDVIALLSGADAATLAAIELYERTHRARRTVLAAVARESRRRG